MTILFSLYKKILDTKPIIHIMLVTIFIIVRSLNLGSDILNTDAERWHRRSENFLNALKQENYIDTYQRYHPGVTLMWFNSIVKQFSYEYQLNFTDKVNTLENSDYFLEIHQLSKLFNILVFSVLFFFQLFFISRLFGSKISLLFGLFVIFEPYLIGINRWFHQTSFEVFFSFTSILSLMYFKKYLDYKYFFLSAFLIALSILAKLTSIILAPIYVFLLFSTFIKTSKNKISTESIKNFLGHSFAFCLIIILLVFMFFPALWVNPLFVYNKIFGHVSDAVTENIRGEMITGIMVYLFYPIILAFKLSPLTFLLFLVSIPYSIKSKNFNIKVMLLTVTTYYIFLTLTEQKIDRYSLVFFPYILLIVSTYISKYSNKIIYLIISTTIFVYLYTFITYHPVYSAYNSYLFGSTKNLLNLGFYDNSGEYFAQAALYLKQKPRDTKVYIPDGYSSFNLYYNGIKLRDFTSDTDYIVTSYDMQRLDPKIKLKDNCLTLEKSFGSKEHDIVFIYKCTKQN